MNNSSSYFTSTLVLILITLKLTGYISWSWWWVLAPFWAPFLIATILLLIMNLVAGSFWSKK